jgi:hypothetical protein
MYTGVDFSGWQYPKGHEGHWTSKDWVIAYDGKSESDEKDLRTEKVFGDFTVIADWRSTSAADPGTLPIGIDGTVLPGEAQAAIARALSTQPSGDGWRRAILTRRGGRLSLAVDRQTVFENVALASAAARGRFVLRHEGRSIEFASIFIKELGSARPPQL